MIITKTFAIPIDELKKKYKVGQIVRFSGIRYKVIRINDAISTICFASFPSVDFKQMDHVNTNNCFTK